MDLTEYESLADIRIVCSDQRILNTSKYALAMKFQYFHTMFLGSIPSHDDTAELAFSSKTLQMLFCDTYKKMMPGLSSQELLELIEAMNFLDIKDTVRFTFRQETLEEIIGCLLPNCERFISNESLKCFADTRNFDPSSVHYVILRHADGKFLELLPRYLELYPDNAEQIADICKYYLNEVDANPKTYKHHMCRSCAYILRCMVQCLSPEAFQDLSKHILYKYASVFG